MSRSFPPTMKSDIYFTAVSAITGITFSPTGPEKPEGEPVTSSTSEGASNCTSVQPMNLDSFIPFNSWSPLTSTANTLSSPLTIRVFTSCCGLTPRKADTSSTLFLPGVNRLSIGSKDCCVDKSEGSGENSRSNPPSPPFEKGGLRGICSSENLFVIPSAFSILAAYPQESQETTASSPVSASTINSWENCPPISPVSASTGLNVSPQRLKILMYASYIFLYDSSAPA